MKKDKVEIEKRGPLTVDTERALLKMISANGKLIQKSETLTIFFESGNPLLGTFERNKMSLSVQLVKKIGRQQGELLLKVKQSAFEKSERIENAIKMSPENLINLLQILKSLNFVEGCPRYYYREDYKLSKYNLTIKKNGLAPDHFEIELITDVNDVIKQKKELESFLNENNLKYYSEKEYKNIMRKTFVTNPPIDIEKIIQMKELVNFI